RPRGATRRPPIPRCDAGTLTPRSRVCPGCNVRDRVPPDVVSPRRRDFGREERPQLDTATPGRSHVRPPKPLRYPKRCGTVHFQETVLLNATVGVSRVLGRLHRPSPPRLA